MVIEWHNGKYDLRAKVYPLTQKEGGEITVDRSSGLSNRELRSATVNWCAWGAQSPEVAKAYGFALQLAADLATQMNGAVKKFVVALTFVKGEQEGMEIKEEFLGNTLEQVMATLARLGDTVDITNIAEIK